MASIAISATVDEAIAAKLERIAAETHRKKSYFVNQALKEYFEQLEDLEVANSRRGGDSVPLDEAKRVLGL